MQVNKFFIWDYWRQVHRSLDEAAAVMHKSMKPTVRWQGFYPLNAFTGIDSILQGFWKPFLHSFIRISREPHLFFAGAYQESEWVTGYGYLNAFFVNDWLGIPATGEPIKIRFGEFYNLADGKIAEVYTLIDVLDVMYQAGINLLPPSKGAEIIAPPPETRDGVMHSIAEREISQATYDHIHGLFFEGFNTFDGRDKTSMELSRFIAPEFRWYGPMGLGTFDSFTAYLLHYQQPFVEAFPNFRYTAHQALIAEATYSASCGFPGIIATHTGEYLGQPATDNPVRLRTMDWWRHKGPKLVESWMLIDMPDLFRQFDTDLFAQMSSGE